MIFEGDYTNKKNKETYTVIIPSIIDCNNNNTCDTRAVLYSKKIGYFKRLLLKWLLEDILLFIRKQDEFSEKFIYNWKSKMGDIE